jgi:ABC-2 type transport system permease protein
MKNTWIVAQKEFIHRVRSRGFILSSIGVPLVLFIVLAISGFSGIDFEPPEQPDMESFDGTVVQIGYVDLAGYIKIFPADIPHDLLKEFPDVSSANQALQTEEIEAYYLIPPEYTEAREIKRVSSQLPFGSAADVHLINMLLASNLFPDATSQELALLRYPLGAPRPQFVSVEAHVPPARPEPGVGPELTPGEEPIIVGVSMMPMLVTVMIIIPLFTSGGYLMQSLAQEKSNRVMEILLVSLRPNQLLAGKLLGFGALTFVQYFIWITLGGLALNLTGHSITNLIAQINLSSIEILYVVLFALGGYALFSAFSAGIGALAPNLEGSSSLVIVVVIPMFIPIYFWVFIVNAPNGVLAVTLSLIPFSAPVAMLMRLTATTVPGWQIALSLALLGLTSYGIIRLMARMFQVQALLSGEAISLRRIWYVLKNS